MLLVCTRSGDGNPDEWTLRVAGRAAKNGVRDSIHNEIMAIVNQERVLSVAVGAAVIVLMVLAFLQYQDRQNYAQGYASGYQLSYYGTQEVTDALVIRPTLAAER